MKLIVNADDFGLTRSVNYGILDAHLNGIVTSTTLMVTMPAVGHAIELMKKYPSLKVGLHLNITLGKPLTNCKSLIKEDGCFYKPKENPDQSFFSEEEIYQEFKAQYFLFIELVKNRPTHLDSHLYAHQKYKKAHNAALRLAKEMHLRLRDASTDCFPKAQFLDFFKAKDKSFDELQNIFLLRNDDYEYAELMVHPAYVDTFLLKNSSYNVERLVELDVLTSDKTKEFIKNKKIELISFLDVK